MPYDEYSIEFIPPSGFDFPTGTTPTTSITIDEDPTRNITNEQTSNIGLFRCSPIAPDQTEADILVGATICMGIAGANDLVFSPSENVLIRDGQYCFSPTETTIYSIQSAGPNCGNQAQIAVRVVSNQAINSDPIPTMSEWGLMIFGLLVLNISVLFLYKQEELLEMS